MWFFLISRMLLIWFPDLLPFFKACYGASTAAWVQGIGGVYEILSERGVHQGDPLGCIGFALAVRHLFEKTNELAGGDVIKGGFAKAYLDDLTTVSTFERTINILKFLIEEGPECGVEFNFIKTKILVGKCSSNEVRKK